LIYQPKEQPGLIHQPREQPGLIPTEKDGHQYLYQPILEDSGPKQRKICGLRTTTFYLSLVLAIVIVAAAVGGGVGGSIAVKNAKTPVSQSQSASSTTTTSTSLATTIWGPVATGLAFSGCPAVNGTTYTSKLYPTRFQLVCGQDIVSNSTSALLLALTSTFGLCMELCATWNTMAITYGKATVTCAGVSFRPDELNGDGNGDPVDCALKSDESVFTVDSGADSAILLGS